jgi:raffinose/stachyose/melibiose transport system permease protein
VTATRQRTAWLFLLPALVFFAVFVLWPIVHTIGLSLGGEAAPGGAFARLLHDPKFFTALGNNLLLVVLSLVLQLPIAMALALLLCGRLPGRGVLRTIYFAPMVVPTAAIAFLWQFLYAPAGQGGLLNQALATLGLGTVNWLGDPDVSVFALIAVVSWRYIGFHTVIFMAGIESIPAELNEAARIDGASEWELFRDVTLPMLRRVVAVSATLSIIGSLKYFDIFFILSPGGGARGSATELVTTYMWRTAFRPGGGDAAYASAMAVALLVVTAAVAVPTMKFLHGKRGT